MLPPDMRKRHAGNDAGNLVFPLRLAALRASGSVPSIVSADLGLRVLTWLGDEDSNLGAGIQIPVSYH